MSVTSWTYFDRYGDTITREMYEQAIIADIDGRATVGKRELEMLLRARRSGSKSVVIPHTKERDRERLALRRLCERGLFSWPNAFGGPGMGWLYRYSLTERGRAVWLRCR